MQRRSGACIDRFRATSCDQHIVGIAASEVGDHSNIDRHVSIAWIERETQVTATIAGDIRKALLETSFQTGTAPGKERQLAQKFDDSPATNKELTMTIPQIAEHASQKELVIASPAPSPPSIYRLPPSVICKKAGDHPTVEVITGRRVPVDQCGLIVPGRRWPIYEPPSPEFVERALAWCRLAESHQIQKPKIPSYGAKHTAERWAGEYVSNGALILAAGQLGFAMSQDGFNTQIAISRRWYSKHRRLVIASEEVAA